MSTTAPKDIWSRLEARPLTRLSLYYVALIGGGWTLFQAFPGVADLMAGADLPATGDIRDLPLAVPPGSLLSSRLALEALLAVLAAFLLAIPSAWVYQLTRHKKGYQQSVVQSLILLPVLVAGVVVIVKTSLALAFGLAGVVAAVRFKNSLDDSKDAVYVFLCIAMGLAAGVQVVVALAISLLFNLITLLLWMTDFGRSPANLEGKVAEARLKRAQAIANRTGAFVAMVDEQILKEMSPEQLDVLTDRAWRRRKRVEPDLKTEEQPVFSTLLRVHTRDIDRARATVEPALVEARLKAWRFGGVVHEPDGLEIIEYSLQFRPGQEAQELRERLAGLDPDRILRTEIR